MPFRRAPNCATGPSPRETTLHCNNRHRSGQRPRGACLGRGEYTAQLHMNDLILRSAILLSLVHAAAIEGLAPAWQAPASSSMRLASVQVKGANRYTPADVTKLSGLVIGNPAT